VRTPGVLLQAGLAILQGAPQEYFFRLAFPSFRAQRFAFRTLRLLPLYDSHAFLVPVDECREAHVFGKNLVKEELHRLIFQLLDVGIPQGIVFLALHRFEDFEMLPFMFLCFGIREDVHDGFFGVKMESQLFAQAFKKYVPAFLVVKGCLKCNEKSLDFGVLRIKFGDAKEVLGIHGEILVFWLVRRWKQARFSGG
jgi:hypothetical protein